MRIKISLLLEAVGWLAFLSGRFLPAKVRLELNVSPKTADLVSLGREVLVIPRNVGDVTFSLTHLRFVTYLNDGERR